MRDSECMHADGWGRCRRRWRKRRRRGRDTGGLRHHDSLIGDRARSAAHIVGIGEVSGGWWPGPESNQRHPHFQCGALPTELPGPQECIPKDVQKPEYNKSLSGTQLGAWGDGRLKGASTRSRGSFRRVQQPARAIGKARAGNRSVARSCRPPVCSDRCSTFRKAPSVRPCTDRRGVRTWQLRP